MVFILVIIGVISLCNFLGVIYDDDEAVLDLLCVAVNLSFYFLVLILVFYIGKVPRSARFVRLQEFVSYLASKEKSPPANFILC